MRRNTRQTNSLTLYPTHGCASMESLSQSSILPLLGCLLFLLVAADESKNIKPPLSFWEGIITLEDEYAAAEAGKLHRRHGRSAAAADLAPDVDEATTNGAATDSNRVCVGKEQKPLTATQGSAGVFKRQPVFVRRRRPPERHSCTKHRKRCCIGYICNERRNMRCR